MSVVVGNIYAGLNLSGGTLTGANNGLSLDGTGKIVQLGGTLIQTATLNLNGNNFIFDDIGLWVVNFENPGSENFGNGDNYDMVLAGNIVYITYNYRTAFSSNPGTGIGGNLGDYNQFALVNAGVGSGNCFIQALVTNTTTTAQTEYAWNINFGGTIAVPYLNQWVQIPASWTDNFPATIALEVKWDGTQYNFRFSRVVVEATPSLSMVTFYMQVDPRYNIEKTNGNSGNQGNDATVIPVLPNGYLTQYASNLYDASGNIFLKQSATVNQRLISGVGNNDFTLYTVAATFNQLLRIDPFIDISSLGASTVIFDLLWTDESGNAVTTALGVYTSLATVAIPSQVIYAEKNTPVKLRVTINVAGAQVNLYAACTYLGVEN